MTMGFRKASNRRLTLATVPRESSAADRLLDNSRQMIRLDLVDDNPRNPRSQVDENTLGELAASIAEHGLLQAPVVRRHPDNPDRYMIVLGARRVAAHRLLGREEVEVIIRRLDDHQAFLASCVENVQRVELSPREEMDMIGVLVDELGSQEAAARALGKSPTWLSKRKRVLSAPALAAAVERGEISLDHAYDVITRSPDEETALTQLEQVRIGHQSQGMTRGKLTPRPHRPERTLSLSDRNITTESSAETSLQSDTLSGRNDEPHETIDLEPETVVLSARNSSNQGQAVDNRRSTEEDSITLMTLATVQLIQGSRGHASRQAVLRALRSDLAMIEDDQHAAVNAGDFAEKGARDECVSNMHVGIAPARVS
jgi:ParB/RepB/Spo0J family partition protein